MNHLYWIHVPGRKSCLTNPTLSSLLNHSFNCVLLCVWFTLSCLTVFCVGISKVPPGLLYITAHSHFTDVIYEFTCQTSPQIALGVRSWNCSPPQGGCVVLVSQAICKSTPICVCAVLLAICTCTILSPPCTYNAVPPYTYNAVSYLYTYNAVSHLRMYSAVFVFWLCIPCFCFISIIFLCELFTFSTNQCTWNKCVPKKGPIGLALGSERGGERFLWCGYHTLPQKNAHEKVCPIFVT